MLESSTQTLLRAIKMRSVLKGKTRKNWRKNSEKVLKLQIVYRIPKWQIFATFCPWVGKRYLNLVTQNCRQRKMNFSAGHLWNVQHNKNEENLTKTYFMHIKFMLWLYNMYISGFQEKKYLFMPSLAWHVCERMSEYVHSGSGKRCSKISYAHEKLIVCLEIKQKNNEK